MPNKQTYLQDKYSRKAKKEGFKSRAAYKLLEMQEKFSLFKKGDTVIDIGCAPGSWLQVILSIVGPEGLVVGIDKEPTDLQADNLTLIQTDIISDLKLVDSLPIAQVIVSDVAPKTSGIPLVDIARSVELGQAVWEIACKKLAKNGNFVCKLFAGQDSDNFYRQLKPYFKNLAKYKPLASRKGSREFYIVGKCFLFPPNKG